MLALGASTAIASASTTHGLVVSSPGAAYTTVRLAHDLTLGDPGYDLPARLTVSDPAHFIGVGLVNTKAVTVQGFTGHLSETVMSLPNGAGGYRYEQRPSGAISYLPRGTYWLVVFATAPERISWPLGVSGTYRATHRTTYTTTVTSGGPIAESYGHATIGANAQIWSYVWTHGSDLAYDTSGVCTYDGTDPVALRAESLPAFVCDGGLSGSDGPHSTLPTDAVTWMVGDMTRGLPYWPNIGVKISEVYAGDVQWTAGRQLWFNLPT
jgi:hypothetical protein